MRNYDHIEETPTLQKCDIEEAALSFRENYDLKVEAVDLGSGDIEADALTFRNYELKVGSRTLRKLRPQSRRPYVAEITTSK